MNGDFSFWEYDQYHTVWDVCIIGAGITGISTGISILEKKPGARVLVVDRWFIPLGASTRNAGFACFGSPSEILDDIHRMGEEDAIDLVYKRWQGLQRLKHRLWNKGADFETVGGYELLSRQDLEEILPKLPYLNSLLHSVLGLPDVFSEIPVPDGISGFDAAIFNAYEGQLHPVKMMEELKNMFVSLGGKVWTGLAIEHIEDDGKYVYLRHKSAFPIQTKHAIVTTNAFASELVSGLDVQGARNHVLVTEPIPQLSWKGCFHYDKGFFYFRNIGKRILLGGARNKDIDTENTSAFGWNPVIAQALEIFLAEHLLNDRPYRIDFRWSGIIAVGKNKLPIIQSLSPRLSVGVRCSGMGIALASLIGEELADLFMQQAE